MFDTAWHEQLAMDGRRAMGLSCAAALHVAALAAAAAVTILLTEQVVGPPPPTVVDFGIPLPDAEPAGAPDLPAAAASLPSDLPAPVPEPMPEAPMPEPVPTPTTAMPPTDFPADPIGSVLADPRPGSWLGIPGGSVTGASGTDRGTGPAGPGDGPGDGPTGVRGSGEPHDVVGAILPPHLELKVSPDYPEAARVARMPGRVTLRAVIDETGQVRDVEVVHSSNRMFEPAAVDAVRQWRYRPATLHGNPVAVYFNVIVEFTLALTPRSSLPASAVLLIHSLRTTMGRLRLARATARMAAPWGERWATRASSGFPVPPAARSHASRGQPCARGHGAGAPSPAARGSLHHPVLFHADRALNRAGWTTLRFDFRGVDSSEGLHDDGRGEVDDVASAVSWLRGIVPDRPLVVVGYSFGSWCAIRYAATDDQVTGLVGIGMPVRTYDFEPWVRGLGRPLAAVHGEAELATPDDVQRVLDTAQPRGSCSSLRKRTTCSPSALARPACASPKPRPACWTLSATSTSPPFPPQGGSPNTVAAVDHSPPRPPCFITSRPDPDRRRHSHWSAWSGAWWSSGRRTSPVHPKRRSATSLLARGSSRRSAPPSSSGRRVLRRRAGSRPRC